MSTLKQPGKPGHSIVEGQSCAFCTMPATRFFFSFFVCDSEVCLEKARAAQGGPAGHWREKAEAVEEQDKNGNNKNEHEK
jgi:hypothetical protein